jgi:hypothetical protein
MLFDQKDSLPLRRVLRGHRYTSHGSYPLHFIMGDGSPMCFDCAVENRVLLVRALKDTSHGSEVLQWRPLGVEVTYEGEHQCANCYAVLETAHEWAAKLDKVDAKDSVETAGKAPVTP